MLYDSNKHTISNTTVTPKLDVTIKEKWYICYYDNLSKYWSVFAKKEEIDKIIGILKNLNVTLKYSPCNNKSPPEPCIEEAPKHVTAESSQLDESDTDASVNRRTKESILSRMASMGQSVLPKHALPAEKTSDSSDTNETNSESKIVRHKPVKCIVKRINTTETKNFPESHRIVETHNKMEQSAETPVIYSIINGQLVPLTNSGLYDNTDVNHISRNLNLLISEQRVSNSELRININRTTDKLDQIFDKIKDVPHTNKCNSNLQNEIVFKLLSEYENKIKMYENILKHKNIDLNSDILSMSVEDKPSEVDLLKTKIATLHQTLTEKDNEIAQLNQKIEISDKNNETDLLEEIKELKKTLRLKDEESLSLSRKVEEMTLRNSDPLGDDFENKLKIIMNDMFQSISANFESNENYSGKNVKSTVASIVKKVTIESLNK